MSELCGRVEIGRAQIPESQELHELQELHRNIVQHIQRESFPRSNRHNDATVHQVLQYYFRFTARFDLKFENRITQIYRNHIKVN